MRWGTLALALLPVTACGRLQFDERVGDAAVGSDQPMDDAAADAAMRVPLVSDDFERSVAGGWGTAPIGGPWSEYNPNGVSLGVAGGTGNVGVTASPGYVDFNIDTAVARDVETRFVVSFDRLPASGLYRTEAIARQSGTGTAVGLAAELHPDGALTGFISAAVSAVDVDLTTPAVAVSGVVPGERIVLMVRATGVQPMRVCGSIWRESEAEPATCMYEGEDARAGLEVAGISYLTATPSNGTVPMTFSFDDFEYVRVGPQ